VLNLLAHQGQPLAPHEAWAAWNLDPLLIGGLVFAVWAYRRGAGRLRQSREAAVQRWCFLAAIAVLALALVSPLDAMSSSLASAHMVQHVLLILVAAPLFALGAPAAVLVRALRPGVRRAIVGWRRRTHLSRADLGLLRQPATAWLLHVGMIWFWHASGPYDAAVRNEFLHILEHVSFLVTGVLFWGVVLGRRSAGRVWNGLGVLLVFAMAMQSTFLSMLLTFARTPWYSAYDDTTTAWHLDQLADQQLAGAIMWVPASAVYVAAGLFLTVSWVRNSERDARPVAGVDNH
jgi:putative membrane protein